MQSRIQALQSRLTNDQCFLITNPLNVRYLSGYSGSNGILLVWSDAANLYTDARYEIQAATECFDVEVRIEADLVKAALGDSSAKVCLFEANHVSVASLERMKSLSGATELVPSQISIAEMRVVKDAKEISLIRQACQISTAALADVVAQIRIGLTEKQITQMLERTMIDMGADSIAFETIVASGPNSAIPHHQPTDREVCAGDLLKIDFGAKISGYHSDCTRTFVLGKPASWQLEIHAAVREAQGASRGVVRAGVLGTDIVNQTIQALTDSGQLENFRHGLGHGVGLAIHEDPFLSKSLTTTLEAGTVFTIEPGVYLPNKGGVRIEDTIVVTETGYENLTEFSYELQEIG